MLCAETALIGFGFMLLFTCSAVLKKMIAFLIAVEFPFFFGYNNIKY